MINRNQEQTALEALHDTPVVLLVGPRQVGKSTLAQQLASAMRARTVQSLDDPATRAAAREDPNGFVAGLRLPAVLDEVQRVPDLMYGIKTAVDGIRLAGDSADGSFLLTGSASIWDTIENPESLAGRIERVAMWPFSQGELAGRREHFIDALFDGDPPHAPTIQLSRAEVGEIVVRGGYPEVQGRAERRAQRWFSEYISRVLDRDIRDLANVRRPEDLLRLLTLCATRAGSLVNVDSMLGDLGMSLSTGRRYYELLSRVYLVREIPSWGNNLARSTVRSPKLLITDSGLAAHLAGYSQAKFARDVNARPGAGHLFENFVSVELLKASSWCREETRAFHWRDQSGREVDLLLERRDGSLVAFEHKLGTSVDQEHFKHLAYLRDQLGDRFVGGAVIYTGQSTLAFGERLWAVPVEALWA
ncbi:MAG TPA: ATP-binding protein [Solirubrobacteraceae bacterium]